MRQEMRVFIITGALIAMAVLIDMPARSVASEPLACINAGRAKLVTQILTLKKADQQPIPIVGELTSWNPQTGEIEVLVRGQTQPVKSRAPVSVEFSVRRPGPMAQSALPEAS